MRRLAEQDPAVRSRDDFAAALPPVATANVCNVARSTIVSSVPCRNVGRLIVRHEEQARKGCALLSESYRVDARIERKHDLRRIAGCGESHDVVGVLRPGRCPQGAIGRECEAADADVAIVTEGLRRRIEDVNATARRNVNQPVCRVDGQGLRNAFAELGHDAPVAAFNSKSGPPPVAAHTLPAASSARS